MIKSKVDNCIRAFEQQDIEQLQNNLFELVRNFNQLGSGQLITSFPEKDRLGECFCLCLMYDWMNDAKIREVWAENEFYCQADYLLSHLNNKQDLMAVALNLFNILNYGEKDLRTKFEGILTKGVMVCNPIFSKENYVGGYKHLIREFRFFAATILSPLVAQYPSIIALDNRQAFEFAMVPVEKILAKIQFISEVIGSILNDV